jgi:acetolactate synthase-1/3 small subunit
MISVFDSHTISIYLLNKPGSLLRVAQVFSRRGFNIDALSVSPVGHEGHYSRMTITSTGDQETLDQIIKQVSKLVDVVQCTDHQHQNTIERELALIKVRAEGKDRPEILQLVTHFKAQTVDFSDESLIVQVTGSTEKLDALLDMLQKYGVIEVVRTGKLLIARGKETT